MRALTHAVFALLVAGAGFALVGRSLHRANRGAADTTRGPDISGATAPRSGRAQDAPPPVVSPGAAISVQSQK